MEYEYVLREDGSIIDTISARDDMGIARNQGLYARDDYYVVKDFMFYNDFQLSKKVFIVDVEKQAMEKIHPTIRTKLGWDHDIY